MPLTRTLILLRRAPGESVDAFNARALAQAQARAAGCAEAGLVALYLVDDEAGQASHRSLRVRARFDALLEVAAQGAWCEQTELAIAGAYQVRQRSLKADARERPSGLRTPGIWLISPVYRAPALSRAAFDAHWLKEHGPLALRHHVGLCAYRQNTVERALAPGSPACDGIAQLGFPTLESFRDGLFDGPAGQQALLRDMRRFVDLARTEIALMGQYVLKS